jgi:GT2 family glycosyltransferase
LEGNVGLTVPSTLNESGINEALEWEEKYYLPCHFMVSKRSLIMDELGGLDERFFVAYQDWDLIKRMDDLGYITMQHNKSFISHYGYSKYSKNKRTLWNADYKRYLEKWGKPLEKRNF